MTWKVKKEQKGREKQLDNTPNNHNRHPKLPTIQRGGEGVKC